MDVPLLAFQWTELAVGILIVLVMMGFFLTPYLIKENTDGKKELGPLEGCGRADALPLDHRHRRAPVTTDRGKLETPLPANPMLRPIPTAGALNERDRQ